MLICVYWLRRTRKESYNIYIYVLSSSSESCGMKKAALNCRYCHPLPCLREGDESQGPWGEPEPSYSQLCSSMQWVCFYNGPGHVRFFWPPHTGCMGLDCLLRQLFCKNIRWFQSIIWPKGPKSAQVIVFSTAYEANKETSFDHPNIPAAALTCFEDTVFAALQNGEESID